MSKILIIFIALIVCAWSASAYGPEDDDGRGGHNNHNRKYGSSGHGSVDHGHGNRGSGFDGNSHHGSGFDGNSHRGHDGHHDHNEGGRRHKDGHGPKY